MHSKEIFSLAVRVLGLVFLYHGLRDLPLGIGQIISSFPHKVGPGIRTAGSFWGFVAGIFTVIWPLLVAYWLLRGAPLIMRLVGADATTRRKDNVQVEEVLGVRTDA